MLANKLARKQSSFNWIFVFIFHFFSSPLPPLPVNEKQRPATLETAGCRISHADSDGLPEDEGFYTRVDGGPPPIPQREVRPRSVGYGTTPPRPTHQRSLSKPLSPKLPLRHSLPTPTDGVDQTGLRTSWSEPGPESAPPLPPRGCSKSHVYAGQIEISHRFATLAIFLQCTISIILTYNVEIYGPFKSCRHRCWRTCVIIAQHCATIRMS